MKKIKLFVIAFYIAGISLMTSFAVPADVSAVPPRSQADCDKGLLTFPAWHRGLTKFDSGEQAVENNNYCPIVISKEQKGYTLTNFLVKLTLNIIEILMQVIGYICVAYVIWGGFMYLYSQGSPDMNAKARKQILNALVGLVIAASATGIINLVISSIK